MTAVQLSVSDSHDVLDVVEQVVTEHEWMYERRGGDELAVQITGRWCDYHLFFTWNAGAQAVHFSCGFDLRVPQEKRLAVHDLLAQVNDKLWMGHFALWHDDGVPLFRHTVLLRGLASASAEQIEDLVETALTECDRFYPAFQFVIWAGKPADEAMAAAMVDPVGEA